MVGNLDGWTLESTAAINDSGAIVGYGTVGGVQHGFLLTPTPEPSTFALLLFGTIGLGLYRWRHPCRALRPGLLTVSVPAVLGAKPSPKHRERVVRTCPSLALRASVAAALIA